MSRLRTRADAARRNWKLVFNPTPKDGHKRKPATKCPADLHKLWCRPPSLGTGGAHVWLHIQACDDEVFTLEARVQNQNTQGHHRKGASRRWSSCSSCWVSDLVPSRSKGGVGGAAWQGCLRPEDTTVASAWPWPWQKCHPRATGPWASGDSSADCNCQSACLEVFLIHLPSDHRR